MPSRTQERQAEQPPQARGRQPSSLADNPPVELYGPEDGGWYTTRVYDWIPLCPLLRDADVRGYLVLRSLVIEKYKNPVRKLTLLDLCELIPSPTAGQPSSLTRVRGILDALSKVGLVSTPEGGPLKTSSRASAAGRAIRIRVNDLPPEGYAGWRNTEDKLAHLVKVRAERVAEEAGRKSDPGTEEDEAEGGAGRKSDPAGRKSDPRGSKSDPDPCGDLPESEGPLVPSVGTGSGGDALSARSAGDARRASDGSSAREAECGSAASSSDHPSSTTDSPRPQAGKKSSSKAKHTREQMDQVRAVRAFFPADLLNGWTNPATGQTTPPLPDVPALSQAILAALAGDVPAADRTVAQLGARIQHRWDHHGWASKFYAGEIDRLVGAAVAMVRPLKSTDRYGCGNPRCEAGQDVDTGVECPVCPERLAARQKARRSEAQTAAGEANTPSADAGTAPEDSVPAQRDSIVLHTPVARRECAEDTCALPLPAGWDDELCPRCRTRADRAAEIRRQQQEAAARYEAPEDAFASAGPAPF